MSVPIMRYPLDPTGTNPDNLVEGEIHVLSTRTIRAVAPTYGAFYTESLRVYDNATERLLVRGSQYQVVELLQDATLRYGKEICALILILDTNVSNTVKISYQVVGGYFSKDTSAVINLYETALMDNRPVDWINVLNKPTAFNPTIHRHLLEDIYGFEPIVAALERIRNAIIVSDVPAFEYLLDWVDQRISTFDARLDSILALLGSTTVADMIAHMSNHSNPHLVTKDQVGLDNVANLPVVTQEEVDARIPSYKYMTFDMFLYAMSIYGGTGSNYSISPSKSSVVDGTSLYVQVIASNSPDGTPIYWTIDNNTTTDSDFVAVSGVVYINQNRGSFSITTINRGIPSGDQTFRIFLRQTSITGPVVAVSGYITTHDAQPVTPQTENTFIDLLSTCCFYEPKVIATPRSMYVLGGYDRL